jgi:hypothetical protein
MDDQSLIPLLKTLVLALCRLDAWWKRADSAECTASHFSAVQHITCFASGRIFQRAADHVPLPIHLHMASKHLAPARARPPSSSGRICNPLAGRKRTIKPPLICICPHGTPGNSITAHSDTLIVFVVPINYLC